MLLSYRHRRSPYARDALPTPSIIVRRVVLLISIVAIVVYLGMKVLRFVGIGAPVHRTPAVLRVEARSAVSVMIDGADPQRAEDGMKIFEGDHVTTGGNGHALLRFFDGTIARLDEQSDLVLVKSTQQSTASSLSLQLRSGALWIAVPLQQSFSGSITRTIETPALSLTLPTATEAVIAERAAAVYKAEGAGITIEPLTFRAEPIILGEGQELNLPTDDANITDLYAFRTPLNAGNDHRSRFVAESRGSRSLLLQNTNERTASTTVDHNEPVTIFSPKDGTRIEERTVVVKGMVGDAVTEVHINGTRTSIDQVKRTFAQELALPEGKGEFTILVEALGANGALTEQERHAVNYETPKAGTTTAIGAPTITSPAKTGETYRTRVAEVVIRGTAPNGTTKIIVNDYTLQLFDPAKGEWSYVAGTRLGNLVEGSNVYDVVAVAADDTKSQPARVTLLREEGPEGVVTSGKISSRAIDTDALPSNPPLMPGTITIAAPSTDNPYIVKGGTGFLLEGTTSPKTVSIWVNEYRLQLYLPGKTTWNYIVSTELKTLKRGKNTYHIVARNSKDEIVDALDYVVEYEP